MVTYFNKKDMVSFGRYLLSEERTKLIKTNPPTGKSLSVEERLREVYHTDYENWLVWKKTNPFTQ